MPRIDRARAGGATSCSIGLYRIKTQLAPAYLETVGET